MTFKLEGARGVLPVTIGIGGKDGMALPLVKEGAHLPASYRRVFTTTESFQMSAYLHLLLGSRPMAQDNYTLCIIRHAAGAFQSAGNPRYELRLKVDGKGRIEVSTRNLDRKVGQDTSVITYESDSIASAFIKQLRVDAAEHAADDTRLKERYGRLDTTRCKVNRLHSEVWPIAKKKMSLFEKHGYRQCRKNLLAIVADGPSKLQDGAADRLQVLLEELASWEKLLDDRSRQVMAWYR